jgi:hypothetical protein
MPFSAQPLDDLLATAADRAAAHHRGAGAEGYQVHLSVDGFRRLAFSTAWHGIDLTEPRFELPGWAWTLAPVGPPIHWRALALLPRERRVVAGGGFRRRPAS